MVFDLVNKFWQSINWQKDIRNFLVACCIFFGALTVFFAVRYYITRNHIITTAQKQGMEETEKAAKEIDNFLKMLVPLVNGTADDINNGLVPKDTIVARLKEKAPNVTGIGVAFSPFAYNKDIKLFAPYYVEREGKENLTQLENFYDYTLQPRYLLPMQQGPVFLEPFFDPASNTKVAEFGAPFYDQNKNKIGVVFANHSTEHLRYVLQGLSLGYKGYGYVISKKGAYVSHPIPEYAKGQKTIFDMPQTIQNPQLRTMAQNAINGKKGYIDFKDKQTNEDEWIFYAPIPATGWSMISVFMKDELNLNTIDLKRKLINIVLSLILFLIFLILSLLHVYTGQTQQLWIGSLSISFLFLCTIIFMWYTAYRTTRYKFEESSSIVIQDRTNLIRFLQTYQQQQPISGTANTATAAKTKTDNENNVTKATQAHIDTYMENMDMSHQMMHGMNMADMADMDMSTISKPTAPVLPAYQASMPHEPQKPSGAAHDEKKAQPGMLTNLQDGLKKIVKNISNADQAIAKLQKAEYDVTKPVERELILRTSTGSITARPLPEEKEKPAPAPAGTSNITSHTQHTMQMPMTADMAMPMADQTMSMQMPIAPDTASQNQDNSMMSMPGMAGMGDMHHMAGMHHGGSTVNAFEVPTGVYLHYLEFRTLDTIKFIGNFWQRFKKGMHDSVKRGILFPLADPIRMTEVYHFNDNEWEVIGWNVQGELGQNFNYATYPFDPKLIQIQMWSADFDRGVILVPDLAAYEIINPTSLPGIDPTVKLAEWQLSSSFFSYKKNKYYTNFGNYINGPFGTISLSKKSATPDLFFDISLHRYIFIILDLLPIVVIFLILFSILFLVSRELIGQMHYVLATTASLFFGIILAHMRFKSVLPIQQIVFFEYFYFILHFVNIVVTILALLHFLQVQNSIIRYKNMLIPQILYWPSVTLIVLILSLIYFY